MLVRRVEAAGSPRLGYLIACRATGLAAAIDPDGVDPRSVEAAAREAGVRIVMILSTRPWTPTRDRAQAQVDHLHRELTRTLLGKPPGSSEGQPERRPDMAPSAMWVRPASSEVRAAAEAAGGPSVSALLLYDGGAFGLCTPADPAAPPTPAVELRRGGSAPEPTATRAQLRLGDLSVRVLPLSGQRDAVAYVVRESAFTGQALFTGAEGPASDCTDDAVLRLPEESVVHPGWLRSGVQVASVGQERAWRAAHLGGASPGAPSRSTWVPVLLDGGLGGPQGPTRKEN